MCQTYRPSLRSINSLPSAQTAASGRMAARVLPPLPCSMRLHQSRAPGERADRRSLSATMLPELPTGSQKPQAEHASCSNAASHATAGTESSMSEQLDLQNSSGKPDGPRTLYRRLPKSEAEHADEKHPAERGGFSSGVGDCAPEDVVMSSAAARAQADGAQDLGSWLWRPWMWVGLKRGIKRRAAQC